MNGRKGIGTIIVVFLLIVALWAASVLFVPHLLGFIERTFLPCAKDGTCPNNIESYGAVGDLFGAVNALFSGLALASIAVTLWIDSKSRREQKKPFLIASKAAGGDWVVGMPRDAAGKVRVPLSLEMEVTNPGQEVALNVRLDISIESTSVHESMELQVPLVPAQNASESVVVLLEGEALEYVLGRITSKNCVLINVATSYTSMESVSWKTCVVYEVSLSDERRDLDLLNMIRAGTWRDDWKDAAKVPLQVQVKRGSWSYGTS